MKKTRCMFVILNYTVWCFMTVCFWIVIFIPMRFIHLIFVEGREWLNKENEMAEDECMKKIKDIILEK